MEKNLNKLEQINIAEIDINSIPDIDEVKISRKQNIKERITEFLIDYENPYFFKSNGKIIKIEFSNNNRTAEECISSVISDLYQ